MAKAARFRNDRRGAAAILFALSLPMLIGGLGLGLEVSNWFLTQRGMQNAADAGALAAATNGSSNYDLEAKAVAAQYGFTTGVTAANNAACPGGGNTCYRVTISGSVPLYLSPVVGYAGNGQGQQNLSATAIAGLGTTPRAYCILALAANGVQGITSNGAAQADLSGCNIKSNTTATCSGNNLNADVGDTVGANNGCGVKQASGLLRTPDPYSGLASNIPADPCGGSPSNYPQEPSLTVVTWSGSRSLSGSVPTSICGDLKLTGNVTVTAPSGGAVLVIRNGRLDTNGYSFTTSNGSALTVVFSGSTGGGYVHAPAGNGTIIIVAPTTGLWKDFAFYQDPKLTSGVDISLSSATWDITGIIYLPHSNFTFSGGGSGGSGQRCFVMVVNTLLINGTGSILSANGCQTKTFTKPTGAVPNGRGQLVS